MRDFCPVTRIDPWEYGDSFVPGFALSPPIQATPTAFPTLDHIVGNVELGGLGVA